MKYQKNPYLLTYERRLQKYLEEKKQLIQKSPMANPTELQEAIKKLAYKYKI